MQPLRHLPPQFLLTGWKIRKLRWGTWPLAPSSSPYSTRPEIPLLHELFPEDAEADAEANKKAENSNGRSGRGQDRHIPRLPLKTDFKEIAGDRSQPLATQTQRTTKTPDGNPKGCTGKAGVVVLLLQNASKSLGESDFRRLIPRGQHIESWEQNGKFIKVIPGRDPNTLQPLGHYYLLFSSLSSALVYKEHILRLHRLAADYTPNSLTSPLPPPPNYLLDEKCGEDVYELLQAYTLLPSSQRLSSTILKEPYSPALQQLIDNGGYPRLTAQAGKSKNIVLLSVEGVQLSTYAVETAIARDGRERSLPWGTLEGRGYITKLNSLVLSSVEGEADDSAEEAGLGYAKTTSSRWLISLINKMEAKRFVRAWHQRAFPMPKDGLTSNDPPPTVKAELVW